jgi:prolyl oligopeptidase
MSKSKILSPALMLAVLLASCATTSHMQYPVTRKDNQTDIYHGTKVADPYRWLEDDNSAETKAWVEAQNKVTFGYLKKIPERAAIKSRLTQLWNFERYGVPYKQGDRYFFSKNDGLQNQSVIYTAPSLDAEPKVLLDPNKLSADGTMALSGYDISDDGNLMAYGISTAGSDWQEWKVRDVKTGKDHADHVKWVKFSSASWTKDGKGFFYSRYDEPTAEAKLTKVNYFHKLY